MKTRIKHITMAFGRTFSVPPPGGGPKGGVRGSKKGGGSKNGHFRESKVTRRRRRHLLSCHEYSTPRIWVKKKVCFIPKNIEFFTPHEVWTGACWSARARKFGHSLEFLPKLHRSGNVFPSRSPIPSVFGNGTSAWIPSMAGSGVLEQNIESCMSGTLDYVRCTMIHIVPPAV